MPVHPLISKPSRLASRIARDRTGGAAIEYAFAAPPFIALLTGILYIGLTYLGQAGLETVAESAGRMMMTGQAQTTTVTNTSGGTDVGMSAADFKNALCNGMSGTSASGIAVLCPPDAAVSHL